MPARSDRLSLSGSLAPRIDRAFGSVMSVDSPLPGDLHESLMPGRPLAQWAKKSSVFWAEVDNVLIECAAQDL